MTTVPDSAAPDPASSRSAVRALDVFEAFRGARRPLSLSEIARLTDIPVSTCHGVMRALEQRGFLYYIDGRDVYPTSRLWDLADELRANDPVLRRLEPALVALRDDTGETVIVGTRQGDSVLYLLVLESAQSIRYSSRTGDRKPLHSSAIGKVMLGAMSATELDAWIRRCALPAVTPDTIVEPVALKADLAASHERGWFVTRGENVVDVMAIAVPANVGGHRFGVAVAGPIHRMRPAESTHAARLTACVRSLERDERA